MSASRITRSLLAAIAIVAMATSVVDAGISVRINRVGLFAGAQQKVRDGVVTFVEVGVRNQGAAPFEGVLQATQTDRDGDVVISELVIAVTPDGNWESKEIYFVPNMRDNDGRIVIKLYTTEGELLEFADQNGAAVKSIRSDPYYDQPEKESFLIVTMMSGNRLVHGQYLTQATQGLEISDTVAGREIEALAPRELPRKTQGLDAVDAIIWEDADPGEITAEQAEALIGWVRQGGRLVISVASQWQSISKSPLAEILPAQIHNIEDVRSIPALRGLVLTQSVYDEFAEIIKRDSITRCRMRPHAESVAVPSETKPDNSDAAPETQDLDPIAYRRYVGRGMVVLLGARLMDLLPPPNVPEYNETDSAKRERKEFAQVVERVVASNLLAIPPFREAKGDIWQIGKRENLYGTLTRTIGFSAVTSLFLILAIGFTGVYTLVATLGSYFYLNKKGWTSHCWTAFSAVSIIGVVIGLGMVWVLRGFSTKVWQTSIVDARAGVNYGYGTCLFGVKTKDHTRLDLKLPVGYEGVSAAAGPLISLPQLSDPMSGSETSFVASDTYRLTQTATQIEGVPVRATLKQFEGRWHGELGGTLEAELIFDDQTDQFLPSSYIRNELGFALSDCYLLEGEQEIAGEGGRIINVRCHRVGTLGKSGEESSSLEGAALVKRFYETGELEADGTPKMRLSKDLFLSTTTKTWRSRAGIGSIFGAGKSMRNQPDDVTHTPFLLLSVYNLLDPEDMNKAWDLQRSYGRRLDCSHWISKHTAVLIGFSNVPSQAVLEIDRANERPERALTMYRFLIPVERN